MKREVRKINEDGTLVQVTTADERWYIEETEEGVTAFPSVTWITEHYPKGIGFYKWLAKHGWSESESLKESAGDRGHKVHQLIGELLKGKSVDIDGFVKNSETGLKEPISLEEYQALMAFSEWFKKTQPETVESELTVINREYGYAGTADYICKIDGETWLIDFKTGQNVWPSYELQLAAYAHALQKYDIKHLAVLQIGYQRNKNRYKLTEVENQFELFLAVKQIWEKETKGQKPFKADYPVKLNLGVRPAKSNS